MRRKPAAGSLLRLIPPAYLWLAIICGLSTVGLGAALSHGCQVGTDSYHYLGSALGLVRGEGFVWWDPDVAALPMTRHTPGTSLLYALFLLVGVPLRWVPVICSLIAWNVILVSGFLLTRALTGSDRCGLIACLCFDVQWSMLKVTGWADSHVVFLAFAVLTLYAAMTYPLAERKLHPRRMFWLCLFAAAAMLARYVGVVLLAALAVVFVYYRLRDRDRALLLKELAILSLSTTGLIAWMVRNMHLAGSFSFAAAAGEGASRHSGGPISLPSSLGFRTYQLAHLFVPGGFQYQVKTLVFDDHYWIAVLPVMLAVFAAMMVTALKKHRASSVRQTAHPEMLGAPLAFLVVYIAFFVAVDTLLHGRFTYFAYFTPVAAVLIPLLVFAVDAHIHAIPTWGRALLAGGVIAVYAAGIGLNAGSIFPAPVRTADLEKSYGEVAEIVLNLPADRVVVSNFGNPFLGYFDQLRVEGVSVWLQDEPGENADLGAVVLWAPEIVNTHPAFGVDATEEAYEELSAQVEDHAPGLAKIEAGYARIYVPPD